MYCESQSSKHRLSICGLAFTALITTSLAGQVNSDESAESREFGCLTSVDDIKMALPSLTQTELEYLDEQRTKFSRLSRREQQAMRRMHESIMASEDPARLYRLLKRYQDWLGSLPAEEREELLSLGPAQRLDVIKQKLSAMPLPSHGGIPELNPEDARAFVQWLGAYVDSNEEQLIALLPMPMQQRIRKMRSSPRRSMMLASQLFEHGRDLSEFPLATPQSIEHLMQSLSPQAREQVQTARDESNVRELFRSWLQVIRLRMGSANISAERIQEFFHNELSPQERRRLESLPPEQMQQQLRKMFLERRINRRRWPQ